MCEWEAQNALPKRTLRWWGLKGEKQDVFKDKMVEEDQ